MNQYNNQQSSVILKALLRFLKTEKNITQKQFCEIHGEDETKLTRHKQDGDERYPPETALKYKQRVCTLIIQSYSLDIEITTNEEIYFESHIKINPIKTDSVVYSICRQDDKGEAAFVGYLDFKEDTGTVFLHEHIEENLYFITQGEFEVKNNILSLLFKKEEAASAYFCINIGNSKISLTPLLRGTFNGVNKENNPMCCEVILIKEKNALITREKIKDSNIPPVLSHYFKNKRIQIDNSLISSPEELPNYKSFIELSRVAGDYIGFRLSDDANFIRYTPVRIMENGKTLIKSRFQNQIYEGEAEIFMEKLLAINTRKKGEVPFYVLSIFMVGRLSKEEIKWLNGVLTGITSNSVMPRCSREIWVKSEQSFETLEARIVHIPQSKEEMQNSEYEELNRKYNGLADFLRGEEDNLIIVEENFHKKFKRDINYSQLFADAYQWAKSTNNMTLAQFYFEKALHHGWGDA